MDTRWIQDHWNWLLEDPTGQRIALGAALVLALVACVLLHKGMRWAANHGRHMPALAVGTLGLFYAAVLVLELDPVGWAVAGIIALAVFLGAALLFNQRRQKRPA